MVPTTIGHNIWSPRGSHNIKMNTFLDIKSRRKRTSIKGLRKGSSEHFQNSISCGLYLLPSNKIGPWTLMLVQMSANRGHHSLLHVWRCTLWMFSQIRGDRVMTNWCQCNEEQIYQKKLNEQKYIHPWNKLQNYKRYNYGINNINMMLMSFVYQAHFISSSFHTKKSINIHFTAVFFLSHSSHRSHTFTN